MDFNHRNTMCWRVGDVSNLNSDDPFFAEPHEACAFALEMSEQAAATVWGIWFYEQGTDGNRLPHLQWLYLDGESFIKES